MSDSENTIKINVLIEILPETLQAVVELEKRAVGFGQPGIQTVDTAGRVGELISRFITLNNFDRFAKDPGNYMTKRTIRFGETA